MPMNSEAALASPGSTEQESRDGSRKAEIQPKGTHEMSETIQEAQDRIVQEFEGLSDWEDRYRKIIELGKQHPDIPDEYKTEQFRVRGCQSTVYLHPKLENGKIRFFATSDAMIVCGLVAMLMRIYSGRTPDEILAAKPEFIDRLGLNQHLSQGRANGLSAMMEQIKLYALAFKTMSQARPGA